METEATTAVPASEIPVATTDAPVEQIPTAAIPAATDKVVFGLQSINLKTPESARNFFDLFLTFAAIANIIVAGFPQIPPTAKIYILEGSSVLVLIVKKLEGMFGIVDEAK